MKKILSLILIIFTLFAGAFDAGAKTTTKKKTSTSSVKFSHYSDGCPDVYGHSYSCNIQGFKCVLTFGSYYGLDRAVEIKVTYQGQWEKEYEGYSYDGNGIISFFMSGTPMALKIADDGKCLVNLNDESIKFKLVK